MIQTIDQIKKMRKELIEISRADNTDDTLKLIEMRESIDPKLFETMLLEHMGNRTRVYGIKSMHLKNGLMMLEAQLEMAYKLRDLIATIEQLKKGKYSIFRPRNIFLLLLFFAIFLSYLVLMFDKYPETLDGVLAIFRIVF